MLSFDDKKSNKEMTLPDQQKMDLLLSGQLSDESKLISFSTLAIPSTILDALVQLGHKTPTSIQQPL